MSTDKIFDHSIACDSLELAPDLGPSSKPCNCHVAEIERLRGRLLALESGGPRCVEECTGGEKVRYLNEHGYDHNREYANKFLTSGGIYTIDWCDVHDYSTDVYLKEFRVVS